MNEGGFSQVIAATIILAVTILLIVIAFIWSQGTVIEFLNDVDQDVKDEALKIQSEITILPSPTEVTASSTAFAFLGNTGRTTLHNVKAYYNGNQARTDTVDRNGLYWDDPRTSDDPACACTSVCDESDPGDCDTGTILNMPANTIAYFTITAPSDGNFSGDVIFVTSDETSATYTYP